MRGSGTTAVKSADRSQLGIMHNSRLRQYYHADLMGKSLLLWRTFQRSYTIVYRQQFDSWKKRLLIRAMT